MHFHLIAAPADPSKEATFQKLQSKFASMNIDPRAVHSVELPAFKVGTLDSLVLVGDDLVKYDKSTETAVSKLADTMKTLVEEDLAASGGSSRNSQRGGDWLSKYLLVGDQPVTAYVEKFRWNAVKYRVDKSLQEIADAIQQEVKSMDAMMRNRLATFQALKSNLTSKERQQTGSLATRSLHDVVRREHFILDSEYMCTVLLAVPRNEEKEFLGGYERWAELVVPRSGLAIARDEEFALYAVVVFQKTRQAFVDKARECKCLPREYVYNEEAIEMEKRELTSLGSSAKDQKTSLLRLCRTNFGEMFAAWVHLKMLRVYVEAVLRYGLPPDFRMMVVSPPAKQSSRVREALWQQFAHLSMDGSGGGKKAAASLDDEIAQAAAAAVAFIDTSADMYPYVNFDLKWSA